MLAVTELEHHYYQEILLDLSVGVIVLSPDLRVLSISPIACDLLGLSQEKKHGLRLNDILPYDSLKARILEASAFPELRHEVDLQLPNGNQVRISAQWMDDPTGVNQKNILLALQPAGGPPRADLADTSGFVAWEMSAATFRYTHVSPAVVELLGYPAESWLSTHEIWMEHIPEEDRDSYINFLLTAAETGGRHLHEYRAVAKDGRFVWLLEEIRVKRGPRGRAEYLTGIAIDVTRQRQEQERRIVEERAAAVSELASRIGHDLNNQLMILTEYGEGVLAKLPPEHPARHEVQQMLRSADRLAMLSRELETLGGKTLSDPMA